MEKYKVWIIAVLIAVFSVGCGQELAEDAGIPGASNGPTWQEQYELGVRYLSEGNYEEAILAFTAAIEIDPKQAPAYVGRGDAYTGIAQLSMAEFQEGAELTQEADQAYHSAVADYLRAIELDSSTPETYRKAAEAYVLLGDAEAAIEILKRGVEATGDESLQEWLDALLQAVTASENVSERVTVTGYIIDNAVEYHDKWMAYQDQYQVDGWIGSSCGIDMYGIRFESPVTVHLGDNVVSIEEAGILQNNDPDVTPLYDNLFYGDRSMVGIRMELTGCFWRLDHGEIYSWYDEEVQKPWYWYYPNGDYSFSIESYELLNG